MTDVLAPHIEIKQGELGPKPRIAGKGINISALATWHLKQGMSVDDLVREYKLTPAEVHAGLAYYYDHREEIEEQMRREERELAAIQAACESPLSKKLKAGRESSGG
jgi:uncharacterized protein (DUF433 family)